MRSALGWFLESPWNLIFMKKKKKQFSEGKLHFLHIFLKFLLGFGIDSFGDTHFLGILDWISQVLP